MTQLTRREQVNAITTAERDGQRYCPSCGAPLNYDRGRLPNSAVFNPTTGTVTCARCKRIDGQAGQTGSRLVHTSFTG